jgi:hypothetical protein
MRHGSAIGLTDTPASSLSPSGSRKSPNCAVLAGYVARDAKLKGRLSRLSAENSTPLPLQTVEPLGSTATRTELRIRSASF